MGKFAAREPPSRQLSSAQVCTDGPFGSAVFSCPNICDTLKILHALIFTKHLCAKAYDLKNDQ